MLSPLNDVRHAALLLPGLRHLPPQTCDGATCFARFTRTGDPLRRARIWPNTALHGRARLWERVPKMVLRPQRQAERCKKRSGPYATLGGDSTKRLYALYLSPGPAGTQSPRFFSAGATTAGKQSGPAPVNNRGAPIVSGQERIVWKGRTMTHACGVGRRDNFDAKPGKNYGLWQSERRFYLPTGQFIVVAPSSRFTRTRLSTAGRILGLPTGGHQTFYEDRARGDSAPVGREIALRFHIHNRLRAEHQLVTRIQTPYISRGETLQ